MPLPQVLIVGTGEYTTGYVPHAVAAADKGAGVIGISFFDLQRRGLVGKIHLAGTQGTKFPAIRQHLHDKITAAYTDMDVSFRSYPADDVTSDPQAYSQALQQLQAGDLVAVFTPDDLHFEIALAAVQRGCHVLIAKPLVKTLEEHTLLEQAAERQQVVVAMEVHKRWHPIYSDPRDRIANLGQFSFFQSYMSQPKSQLATFQHWAGRSSDISYYLNSHHIDFHCWALDGKARPVSVVASGATCVAQSMGIETEDTISLLVDWETNVGKRGSAIYTASWIAPPSDVHSQQRFHYMGTSGEIVVDQAHRGYGQASDDDGLRSLNPMFMKYVPDTDGRFAGQDGYGYRSVEAFVDAACGRNSRLTSSLATIETTRSVTAILEAGRRSLDEGGRRMAILYDHDQPVKLSSVKLSSA